MEKINLKGISKILSEKEMKNVMGGSICFQCAGYAGTYICTSGDCLAYLSENCSGGWMQWDSVGGKC